MGKIKKCLLCGVAITTIENKKLNKKCRKCWKNQQTKINLFLYEDRKNDGRVDKFNTFQSNIMEDIEDFEV